MKDKITEQSILLFEKKGFSHTSIQDIVDALSVTKGSFYYYFSSKEELLMEIQEDYINNLLHRQKQIIDRYATPKEKLVAVIHLLVIDINNNGARARVYLREMRHLKTENMENIKQKRALFRLNVQAIVKDGMEQGNFKSGSRADMVTFGILGMTNWSYNWFQPAGEVAPEELADIYAGIILDGLEK